jgi:hypothetical protein
VQHLLSGHAPGAQRLVGIRHGASAAIRRLVLGELAILVQRHWRPPAAWTASSTARQLARPSKFTLQGVPRCPRCFAHPLRPIEDQACCLGVVLRQGVVLVHRYAQAATVAMHPTQVYLLCSVCALCTRARMAHLPMRKVGSQVRALGRQLNPVGVGLVQGRADPLFLAAACCREP